MTSSRSSEIPQGRLCAPRLAAKISDLRADLNGVVLSAVKPINLKLTCIIGGTWQGVLLVDGISIPVNNAEQIVEQIQNSSLKSTTSHLSWELGMDQAVNITKTTSSPSVTDVMLGSLMSKDVLERMLQENDLDTYDTICTKGTV